MNFDQPCRSFWSLRAVCSSILTQTAARGIETSFGKSSVEIVSRQPSDQRQASRQRGSNNKDSPDAELFVRGEFLQHPAHLVFWREHLGHDIDRA